MHGWPTRCDQALTAKLDVLLIGLLAAFLLIFSTAAQAQDTACKGRSLLAEVDAAERAKIEAETEKVINGRGILWKIEKQGQKTSWLFGTMHVTDPRVTTLTAKVQRALEESDTVVIETTDVLDQRTMMGQLGSEPALMMFTDGSSLTDHMSSEDATVLNSGLQKRGIPLAAVAKMKPWMLLSMIALPACEMARQSTGTPVLDAKLALEAKALGKRLLGLETAAEQLRAMSSMPLELHIRSLVETVREGDRVGDILETMITLYEQEEVGSFWPLLHSTLGEAAADDYSAFEQTMIVKRNQIMVERSEPILAKGGAFIAVGALHLPGTQGVVEKLRAAGYKISRAN